jgi:hypothetical protein
VTWTGKGICGGPTKRRVQQDQNGLVKRCRKKVWGAIRLGLGPVAGDEEGLIVLCSLYNRKSKGIKVSYS